MRFRHVTRLTHGAIAALLIGAAPAWAEPQHGIAMYGEPAMPADFTHLPYVNPDAPTGGRIVTAEVGTFDSINPYVLKGNPPWQLRFLIGESLMGRSLDEPFTLYGLLAQSIETGPNREWVEFVLNPAATFSDGSPVTVEDVIWSFETLGTIGNPRYLGFWAKVETIEETAPGTVRLTFNTADRELALLAGLRPILKKAQWENVDFANGGLDVMPITSGPYVISEVDAGRSVTLTRNADYWGRDVVPFEKGLHNIDEIRLEFFADETAAFEAFKTGEVNSNREFNVARWDQQYDFPMVQSGDVVKSVIPHGRPSGMTGFVMNSRQPQFADWRVRDAMIAAFNFEFINDAMTGSQQPRITSYWSNSPLAMDAGPATGRVAELLDPFAADLIPGTMDGYALPVSDGTERNRPGTRAALAQMEAAGWTVQDGVMRNEAGAPFTFDILLQQGASENQAIIDMYVESLTRIGVTPTVTVVDDAQYTERTSALEFDMTFGRLAVSLSPGNEQYLYFGSEAADQPGTRNLMGVKSPAVDSLIDTLLTSEDETDFVAAVQALDRVLTAGRYYIPIYQWNDSRLAHARQLRFPDVIPVYGDFNGWQPDVWWWEE
ncbi:peptide/nickel transport system substrate-binding protein [Loktanella fryxellensis]|uniref:Peptide/nickel transport system substrate-binding protein n=1 Tax=Loktanella fryxellensis TaxID=245187 RepID=A0A1H7Y5Z2_9RHOB|nr:extracellular solute-binding protein [Loktanella fryxellensis]SEM41345.1 peptide/nickel transport system substrate-binding protein [Loktanella fryxellensis]